MKHVGQTEICRPIRVSPSVFFSIASEKLAEPRVLLWWERRLIQLPFFRLFDARLLQINLLDKLYHSELPIHELVIDVGLADLRLFRLVQPLHLLGKLALEILLLPFLLLDAV